jgi:hypothetical protein
MSAVPRTYGGAAAGTTSPRPALVELPALVEVPTLVELRALVEVPTLVEVPRR